MSIHGFVLGVALLACVGWCIVQESVKQTQARYELAELMRTEVDAAQRLQKLHAQEQELRSPARLAVLVRKQKLKLVALGSFTPEPGTLATGRRPGETLDEAMEEVSLPVDMASVRQW